MCDVVCNIVHFPLVQPLPTLLPWAWDKSFRAKKIVLLTHKICCIWLKLADIIYNYTSTPHKCTVNNNKNVQLWIICFSASAKRSGAVNRFIHVASVSIHVKIQYFARLVGCCDVMRDFQLLSCHHCRLCVITFLMGSRMWFHKCFMAFRIKQRRKHILTPPPRNPSVYNRRSDLRRT